jgi:hypothetical protein
VKPKTPSAWAPLKVTLQRLKYQAKQRTGQRKRLKDQLRYRDAVIAKQQVRMKQLEAITTPQQVFNCTYPAQMMALAIFVVLNGGSLRCAAATAGFFAELMGWSFKAPASKTVSNWVERCGLHALQLTKSLTGEYVAIIDASIQIGKEQLLLLLGVKAERAAQLDRPLCMADMEVLGMEVQSSWNGDEVAAFISRSLAERPGISLRYVICDRGSNLLAALRKLKLPVVSDCSHVMMNMVKKLFKDDVALSKLRASVGLLRQQLILTDNSFALPATLRDKDRFGRIFTLVAWMDRIDAYGTALTVELRNRLNAGRNHWLDLRLRQVHRLMVITATRLKHEGLSQASHDGWINDVVDYLQTQPLLTRQAKYFIAGMMKYFTDHAQFYANCLRVQCCSDIIESIFGRYKNKGGMKAISAGVLSIALYNQKISSDFVRQAMRQVSGPQLDEWRCRNVCHNRYGIRKRMERELRKNAGG